MSLAKLIAAKMLGKKGKKPTQEASKSVARGALPAESKSTLKSASGSQSRHLTARAVEVVPSYAGPVSEVIAEDLAAELEAALASAPPAPATPPPPDIKPGWRGSCKAIDADTGRRCRLPAHPGQQHRHERGPFFRTAPPEQTSFRVREQLDAAATRHHAIEIT
jgi:hypothetical protein